MNKYIKLFEDFTEQFDYKLEDIKTILDKRKIDYNNIEYLASGNYGSAFDLGNDNVLKITNMKSEVYYANILKDIKSKYLVDVKDVFFHSYFDIGYTVKTGFILMEKLNTNVTHNQKMFQRFVDIFNQHGSPNLKEHYNNIPIKKVIEHIKDKTLIDIEKQIEEYYNHYINIIKTCKKHNLPLDDLRGGNIGFRNDGTPVFFDIGDIYQAPKHSYIDIDVINMNL